MAINSTRSRGMLSTAILIAMTPCCSVLMWPSQTAWAQSETKDLLPQTFLDRQQGASGGGGTDAAERDAHRRALEASKRLEAEILRERGSSPTKAPAIPPQPQPLPSSAALSPQNSAPPVEPTPQGPSVSPPVPVPAIAIPPPVPVTRIEPPQAPAALPSAASTPSVPAPSPAKPFEPRTPGAMPANTTRDMLVAQGERHLKLGDISSARLFYQRAAEAGSVDAARILGRLFDAGSLTQLGARGIVADAVKSKFWLGYADRLERGELDKLSPKP